MQFRASEDDLPVLLVKLGQGVQVLQSTLSHQVVRVADQGHQNLQRWFKGDLVVVIDDQGLEEVVGRAVEHPLEAGGVQVLELLGVVIDPVFSFDEEHPVTDCVDLLDRLLFLDALCGKSYLLAC